MKHFVFSILLMALSTVCLAHDTFNTTPETEVVFTQEDLLDVLDRQELNLYQKLSAKEKALVLQIANKAIKQHMKTLPMKLVSHQPED